MGDLRVLGLDIATRTGWALSDGAHGAVMTGNGVPHDASCGTLSLWLADMLTEHQPAAVVIEGPFIGGPGDPKKQNRLIGAALAVLNLREIAVTEIAPLLLKRYATGKGNATKSAMIAAANARFGLNLSAAQSDEADALFLAAWGVENVREVSS